MADSGEWFKMSRRSFAKTAAASIVATAAAGKAAGMTNQVDTTTQPASPPAASQPTTSDAMIDARVRWLEDQLGRAIPANLRAKVAKQIAANDAMWKRGRTFVVPDGTEPAFVFQPVARKA